MVTTTSTTSTAATTTATTTTSSVIGSAANALFTSLDTGSGVDTASLVTALVTAQFATKNAQLTAEATELTTQISGVSTLKSGITGFATALATLAKGGTLTTQPTSSNTGVLTATALSGAKLAGLSKSVAVTQIAAAQSVATATGVSRTATIGTGTLTLTLGTATYAADGASMTGFTAGSGTPVAIAIDSDNATIDKIAAKINAAGAGVTASVVTDADGTARLSLKGATGAAQAFTLSADSSGLGALEVGVGKTGTTVTAAAANAKITVDGVAVERSSNSISDLIDGVKLDLVAASTTPVSLTSTYPTSALTAVVTDLVDTYNGVFATVKEQTDAVTGALKSDTAAKTLLQSLKSVTTKTLITGAATGTPTTLAEIGVATTKTGTLEVNDDTLAYAIKTYPAAVEAIFASATSNTSGLSAALNTISTAATSTVYGLGASATRYAALQTANTDAQTAVTEESAATTTRMTAQFSSMNAKVAAYKNTQSFLTQQIAAWNKSDS